MALVFPSIHSRNLVLTLPIREWIALASYWEKEQLKNADGEAAAEARLEYVNRAAARALTLTEEFAFSDDNDSDSDEEDPPPQQAAAPESSTPEDRFDNTVIVAENFEVNVRFQVDGHENIIFAGLDLPSLSSAAKVIEKCTDDQINAILDSTPSVRFISSLRDKKRVDLDRTELELFLHKAGLLFYEFFSRGSIYQNISTAKNGENGVATSSDPNNQNDKFDDGEGGDGARGKKARMHTNHIIGEMGNITLKDVEDELREKQLPLSICRLVGDLIHADATFESTLDILDELEGIIDKPDIFMDDIDRVPTSLDFHEDSLFGRTDERFELCQAINNAQNLVQIDGINSIVLISGDPGSGKSHLANDVVRTISDGWSCLSCKFDQVAQNNRSLSAITSALENYFRGLSMAPPPGLEEILGSIYRRILAPGIVVLSEWIPSFRALYPAIFSSIVEDDSSDESDADVQESKNDNGGGGNLDDENDESNNANEEGGFFNANAFRNRLHYLIRQVFHVISSPANPMLLLLDDLQWADRDSLDLMSSLLMDSHQLQRIGVGRELPPCLVLMGTIRSNVVDEYHMLTEFTLAFEASDSVTVTNIDLSGIDAKSAHSMISHTLGLPLRLTRSLAEAIQRKTLGNPLFIKAFLTSLVEEKLLNYSLAEKRWKWDIEAITAQPIDDNVAMIMKRSILRMPQATRFALTVASCFGSRVDASDLQLLSSSEQFSNIMPSLDHAVRESVMENRGTFFVFVHDMIQQTAYQLLPRPQIEQLHFNIGLQLATATCHSGPLCSDAVLMRATDQVNAAKAFAFSNPQVQTTFATLNKQAADNSIRLTDFPSALSYIKQGLQFLGEDGWEKNHDLCLQFHETACLASYLNALPRQVMIYYQAIMSNTRTLDERLKSHFILIRAMACLGRPKEAIDKSISILDQLEESIPYEITPAIVMSELISTKQQLHQYSREQLLSMPRLKDTKIHWVIRFMDLIVPYLFMVSPMTLTVVGCRMIKLSLCHGICQEFSTGLTIYSNACINALRDVDEGYSYGKIALNVNTRRNSQSAHPKTKCIFFALIAFWREPLQSTANALFESHQEALLIGDIELSSMNAHFYCSRVLHCGNNLATVEKEYGVFLMKMLKTKQMHNALPQLSHMNLITKLTGSNINAFDLSGLPIQNEDEILKHSIDHNRPSLAQLVFFNRMFYAFLLNDFVDVAKLAEDYRGLSKQSMRWLDIFHKFYQGLGAFRLSHNQGDSLKWIAMGEESLAQFLSWKKGSVWNFENKALLLEAELHFARCEINAAEAKYKASIESARRHGFLQEEGIGFDLLGSFYQSCGKNELKTENFRNAYECYNRWGANALLRLDRFREIAT